MQGTDYPKLGSTYFPCTRACKDNALTSSLTSIYLPQSACASDAIVVVVFPAPHDEQEPEPVVYL